MNGAALGLAALVAVAACAGSPLVAPAVVATVPAVATPPSPAAAPARPKPAPGVVEPPAFTLVRSGALLSTAQPPAPAGHGVRLPELLPIPDSPAASVRFRLVRVLGDWVELETVTSDAAHPHCHAPLIGFAGLALRLFAAAADLQPVTVRRVHLPFASGAIDLEPGVPVAREGDRWRVFPDGNSLVVALPPDAVGSWYRPVLAEAIAEKEKAVSNAARVSIGGEELSLARDGHAQCEWAPGRDGSSTGAVYAQRVQPGDAHRVAIVAETACARYAGTVVDSAIDDARTPPPGRWPLLRLPRNRFSARAGAPLRWADGAAAGHLAGEVLIPDDANPDRQHPCFNQPLDEPPSSGHSSVRLCLLAPDLVESPAFLSDQQVAVVTPRTRRQVALRVGNGTARPSTEVENLVRTAARRRLVALGDVVLVPPNEDESLSASRAARGGLARYLLHIGVEETLGREGEMSTRRVTFELTRADGTPGGHPVVSGAPEQFQTAHGPSEEANALEEMVDGAMWDAADGMRQDH